ncbi:MAG: hypothetical protein ACKVOU_04815 [Cytophagales bacterium]
MYSTFEYIERAFDFIKMGNVAHHRVIKKVILTYFNGATSIVER